MNKPALELADIFKIVFSYFCKITGPLPKEYYAIANAIMSCRTSQLGGHIYRCEKCGHEKISYNSCRNRHCPSCQAHARAQWVQRRLNEILPVPYFHVVFTIPSQLNPFALRNKEAFYNILFKAASQSLNELALDDKGLGAELGFITILHTWGQNLLDHPHLHCIVPGGGLDDDRWITCRNKNFLFPVKVLSKLFRGKFLVFFKKAVNSQEILFHGNLKCYGENPKHFRSFVDQLYKTNWVVYAKPPFGGPEAVVKYLGRYTHRIAIANSRLFRADSNTCFI